MTENELKDQIEALKKEKGVVEKEKKESEDEVARLQSELESAEKQKDELQN